MAAGAAFIDTAESYGTEDIVGEAIQSIRNHVFLASKVSPRHFRRSDVLKAAEASLGRLRTDHIDLYQLHWPNYTVPVAETMSAMEELVTAGKIRYIGVSNFSLGELRRAQASLSRHRIVANQVRYSLVDRTIELRLLRYCQQNDITVLAYSPLGHGLQNLRARDSQGILTQVAASCGKIEAQVALNWCLSKEKVVAIPKADSVAHTIENCGASGWELSPDQIRLLDQRIGFRRHSVVESPLRRLARRILQHFGRQQ